MMTRSVVFVAGGVLKSLGGGGGDGARIIRSCRGGGLIGPCRLTGIIDDLRGDKIRRRTVMTSSVFRSGTTMMQQQHDINSGNRIVPKQWEIYTGIVLERKPVISQEMTSIEKEFAEMMGKVEVERSKKSDHEVKKEKDAILIEKLKSGEIEADQVSAQTAQDQEDLWSAEVKNFVPGSRLTEADKKNDFRSLERALDSHLLLVVEQKIGKQWKWICPHGKWENGETLRQTAERTIKNLCPDVKARILGNAPWGVYKYRYPQKTRDSLRSSGSLSKDVIGAKVFFYKAQVASGALKNLPSQEVKDFVWLKRDELEAKLHPEYFKQLAEVLIDERN